MQFAYTRLMKNKEKKLERMQIKQVVGKLIFRIQRNINQTLEINPSDI